MKKLIISILIISIIGLCFITNISNAATIKATVEIEPSATEVKGEDVVTFYFKVTNIENAQEGTITAAGGIITYDKNFFEAITESDCSGTLNTSSGQFNFKFSATSDKDIGTIKLKVKKYAEGSGTVTFSALAAGDGDEMVYTDNKQITISIKEKEPVIQLEEPVIQEPVVEQPPVQEPPQNQTEAPKDIPKTGIEDTLTTVIAIIVIVSLIVYRKYKNYQDIK